MYANPCNSSVNNFSGICHRCDVIMAINLKATASLTNKSQRNVSVLACLCMMARFIEMNLLLMRCDSAFFVCKLITCPWIQSTNERKICSILIESVRTRMVFTRLNQWIQFLRVLIASKMNANKSNRIQLNRIMCFSWFDEYRLLVLWFNN